MIYNPPTLPYCGLTIILGKPSRFDTKELFSGHAGQVFKSFLHPLVYDSIDIRTSDNGLPLRDGTKVVLLLGDESLTRHYPGGTKVTLNDARGNPEVNPVNNIVYLPTYAPQEAFDQKAEYEAGDGSDEEADGEGDEDIKGHGITKRRNWRWWLFNDVKKSIRMLNGGGIPSNDSNSYAIKLYPDIGEATKVLEETEGQELFLDIETARRQVMTCVGFNFTGSKDIFVVPWKRYTGHLMYDDRLCRRFIRALAIAMGRNKVVCHNASFDLLVLCWRYKIPLPKNIADTMLMWHRCYPEVEKSLGHLISYFLYRPFHKNDGVYEPHNGVQEEQLYRYNAKDIITMREIYPALVEELKKCGATESGNWANRMVRPYLTATLRGIKTNTKEYCDRYDALELKRVQVNRCIGIITGRPDMNVRSWQQKEKYLYQDLKLPCPDDKAPTASKTMLRLLCKHSVPSVKLMLLSTRTSKLASSMKFRLWPDMITGEYNRFTCGYNIAGTDSFRLGSRAIFKYKRGDGEAKLGYGCLLPTTEVLTKQGWKKFIDCAEQEEIVQYDPTTNQLSWHNSNIVKFKFVDDYLIKANTNYHKVSYTKDHRIPSFKKISHKFEVKSASQASISNEFDLPVSGMLEGDIENLPLKLIVAIQADGCIEQSSSIRLSFKKEYKINRILELFKEYNIDYSEHSAMEGYRRFYINAEQSKNLIAMLGLGKNFGPWLLRLSAAKKIELLNEIKYWDAHIRGNSFLYFSTNKNNIDWISTLAHTCGYSSSLSIDYDNNAGYGSGNNKTLYTLNIKPRNYILCDRNHFTTEQYSGDVYCAQTKTSYFLIRNENTIVVTGNTNLQNQKKEQRTLIKPDVGLKLGQVDQAGAEALIVAYLCRAGRFRALFSNGIKSHVFVGLHVFKDAWKQRIANPSIVDTLCTLNPADLKAHPDFKTVEKLIKDSDNWPARERYYFIAKMICHASNYGMKAPTFQINVLEKSDGAVELSQIRCREFLELYHRLFPEIQMWHSEIQAELIKTRILCNLFGEPRRFNDHFGDNLWKSAYAFKPQSTVGQITNYAFTEIQELCDAGGSEEYPIREWNFSLLQNNHDSILFQFKPEFEKPACDMVTRHIERSLVSPKGEPFKMKSEAQSGYNWCPYKKAINNDGLKEIVYG